MKITPFNDLYSVALSNGGTVLIVSDGSNAGFGGDVTGEYGDLSVVALGSTIALGSNMTGSVGDVLTIIQDTPSKVAQFATPSNSGAVGSNVVTRTLGGQETVVSVAAAGATETLDLAGGNVFDVTLSADCTIAFTGAVAGVSSGFTLVLTQDGTGGWTVTWPGSVVWSGGAAPTLDTTAGTIEVLTFFTLDGGAVWFGFPTGGGGTPATTVESETTFGLAAAVGTDTEYARQDHTHGTPANPSSAAAVSALGFVGPILISDAPSTPLVFADLIQNEAQDDLVYADL